MKMQGFSLLILLFISLLYYSSAYVMQFTFTLRPRRKLCFEEYFGENILVAISSKGFKTRNQSPIKEFEMTIKDPQQTIISQHRNEELQKHVFTSFFEGEYEICFNSQLYLEVDIEFECKMGLEAQTFTTKKDLQTSEQKMTQLQDQMDKLHQRFVYATIREKALQDVNDTTNSRVLGFGILTLIVVLCAGVAQMVYLRAFFKNKKII